MGEVSSLFEKPLHTGKVDNSHNSSPHWQDILTHREMEVLCLMAQGKNNRTISEQLYISEKTVKNHVSNILHKLDVQDRTQAVLLALKYEWVNISEFYI